MTTENATPEVSVSERQETAMQELLSELSSESDATASPERDENDAEANAGEIEKPKKDSKAERLARIQAREAEKFAEKERIKALEAELAKERRAREHYELRQRDLVDLKQIGPMGIIALAEKAGLSPQDVVDQLREATLSPETAEAKKVSHAFKQELEKLEEKLAALEQAREEDRRRAEYVEAYQTELSYQDEFTDMVSEDAAPYSARFIEHIGRDQYLEVAAEVARALPEGCGLAKVLEVTEKELAKFARVYGASQATPKRVQAPRQVTNRSASARGSVMTEDDLAKLSYEERRELLFAELKGR